MRWTGFILLVLSFATLIKTALYYHSHYLTAQEQLEQQQTQMADMQHRLKEIATLDKKYAEQRQMAASTVNELERDTAAGQRRLQLAARCMSANSTSTTRVDDGARPGLDDAAQRNYFTLRERIETSRLQIAGLQDYIREQCVK